jgi:hypothetical protein
LTSNGTAVVNASENTIVYTPDEGFIGQDSFEYNVSDGKGGYDTAVVTLIVSKDIPGDIVRPKKDHMYIGNIERFAVANFLKFIDADAFIIGPITFEFEVDDPDFIVEKVEFYINDELINTTSEPPFEWTFNERFFKICTIKAVAYGTLFGEENIVTDSIDALIFNFGLTPS